MNHIPFCPNPFCRNHLVPPPKPDWYTKSGTYPSALCGRIQRYVCKTCGKKFSTQTFSIDYYTKRRVDYHRLVSYLTTTSSCRDIAREMNISTATVCNRTERLCRSMMAVHQRLVEHLTLAEPLVADGFESYTVSQYFPNNINLLVGKRSQYVYGCTYTTIRRKGRMTERQKQKRTAVERRYRADRAGVKHTFAEMIMDASRLIEACGDQPVELYTDENQEYVRALKNLPVRTCLHHIRISSRKPRTLGNPLFAVNYMDRQIRKDQANHVRETVCFARNVNNAMMRLMVYFMCHNYFKAYRERDRRKTDRKHGEVAGLSADEIGKAMRHVFTKRAFFMRSAVTGFMRTLWLKSLETPLKPEPEVLPLYAFC